MRQALIAAAALGSSKTAGAAGAGVSVVAAAGLGLDLGPFIVGAAGATVVIGAQPPRTRGLSWATAVVSVFFGGVGGPWVESAGNTLSMYYLGTPDLSGFPGELLAAGILSAGWPWFGPLFWGVIKSRVSALGKKGADDAHL
jgi:hypothetical protein